MSQDRACEIEDLAPTAQGPRCSLDHAKKAREHYCGTVREPRYDDERGAVVVVELVFTGGTRRAFFPIQGLNQCQIIDLPPVRMDPFL